MTVDGMPQGPVTVVSPHFDDGVFSCGDLLAERPGSCVITIFGGGPEKYGPARPWDKSAGFEDGEDVMEARRAEDRAALKLLDARYVWLDFEDAQYGHTPGVEEVAGALGTALVESGTSTVLIPCGLFHSDHRLVHAAGVMLMRRDARSRRWFVYEDAIYRRFEGLLDERLRLLLGEGFETEPLRRDAGAGERKRAAVAAYASQIKALGAPGHPGYDDVLEPECYRALVPVRSRETVTPAGKRAR
jgi:LmbE family N-acetylglucosaminyl deacetylase